MEIISLVIQKLAEVRAIIQQYDKETPYYVRQYIRTTKLKCHQIETGLLLLKENLSEYEDYNTEDEDDQVFLNKEDHNTDVNLNILDEMVTIL